ncbi:MAG: phosphate transport system permease protein [Crocinitomicaceae bacterium]|jgi:phosphate transport system permease protein
MSESIQSTPKTNPFTKQKGWFQRKETLGINCLRLATYIIIACALFIFSDIFIKGVPTLVKSEAPFINTEFFTESPQILTVWHDDHGTKYSMTQTKFDAWVEANPNAVVNDVHNYTASGGGILGPLLGTALLVIICMGIALFIGVSAAVYLSEYCGQGKLMSIIRLAILNLAGVPSIVYALFGWGVFCYMAPNYVTEIADRSIFAFSVGSGYISFEGWEQSLLAGGCTLAIMVLPVIITACEESLRAVPKGFREAAFALGATRWQTIRTAVLPYAMPGVLTASVLGITRVAGETAPIMLTAAASDKSMLPTEILAEEGFWSFLTQSVQALPFHIYTLAKFPDSEYVKPMQYGSILVFLLLVMGFSLLSMVLRSRIRKRIKW